MGVTVTDAEELVQVNAAIEAIYHRGAQSYSIGGRTFTSLDLATLYERQAVLTARVNAAANTPGTRRTIVARFKNPG